MLTQAIRCFIFVAAFSIAPLSQAQTAQVPLVERGLELDTPEKAVNTFVALHRAGDFESLWFALDPALRRAFMNALQQFQPHPFIGQERDVSELMVKAWSLTGEHSVDPAKPGIFMDGFPYFAGLLTTAREHGVEAFDFSGAMTEVSRSEGTSALGPLQILTYNSNSLGQVAFELRQAPSKRWRVYGISANAGTPMAFRWAAAEK